jgi:hypothetical protein
MLMAKQTLTFVALPNGDNGRGMIRLSIYMAPRLDQGATLANFPDILNWTSQLKSQGLEFTLSCNGQTVTVPIDSSVLRPDIWQAIFVPQTRVAPYQIPSLTKNLFVSYPARDAMSFVKYAYQQVSLQLLRGQTEKRFLLMLLRDLVFRNENGSTLQNELARLRVELWRAQQRRKDYSLRGGLRLSEDVGAEKFSHFPPDGVRTTQQAPVQTAPMIRRFALFHHQPPAPNRPPLPQTESDFAGLMDFHQALTAVSSYPSVMRALGLVLDVEAPESLCPFSPGTPGGAYLTIAVQGIATPFQWKIRPKFYFPETAYSRSDSWFTAAPATPSAEVGAGNILVGDVINGILALLPDFFHLVEVDIDGALLNAMSLADNVANARNTLEIEEVLPSIRSAGIALMANDRALQVLESVVANQQFDAALTSNSPLPRPFNVRDLVRGYRIDIWSSRTRHWHSLHRRDATYRFGKSGTLVFTAADEEGFTQLAVSQPADDPTRKPDPLSTRYNVPQPGKDVFIHERIAAWTGWSLSVQRPGGALNRSPDPALATDPDPTVNDPKTPFKMVATFASVARSLPELRFGDRYRLRARAVDLAGNSLAVSHDSSTDVVAPVDGELPYLRFEPVPHPVLLLREPVGPGASLARMVIRTFNSEQSLDSVPTAEVDQRHVSPPKAAVRLVEQHGMLDDAHGRLRGDQATYDMLVARDKGAFRTEGKVPMDPRPILPVPYLPDPIARGAAFQNLPNTTDETSGTLVGGHLHYTTIPDVQVQKGSFNQIDFGSFTRIDFGPTWPDRKAFRIVTSEGGGQPVWDPATRVLHVYLPKAEMTEVPLSCYLNEGELSLMGIWDWMRQFIEAEETYAMQNTGAGEAVPLGADAFALLTRWVLEGGHPMLTPSLQLMMVHAVQQPIGRPEFTLLPVVHQPSQPIAASALRNGFSPITAWRSLHSHHAFLLGGLRVHGASTSKLDIQARWREFIDNTADPMPTILPASAHVDTIDVSTLTGGPIAADPSGTRYVATYIPEVDTLWFAATFDSLPGVQAPWTNAAPMHRFSDTKHREVYYEAVATSRFREYFDDKNLKFTRTSDPLLVDVPSSARPVAPDIAYVVPTFGAEREETTNVKSDVRFGNGLRVYLHRPWYSSGEGELLGVVLWPQSSPAPDSSSRDEYKHFITQWGLDPIWQTGQLDEMPAVYDFSSSVGTAQDLSIDESTLLVDVAGHNVGYDGDRRLWYCDITFENPVTYSPFVRLALARYQPRSIPGVELSHVVLADFAQLSPDRSAVVSVDPADPRKARVFIGGLAPIGPSRSFITVAVERHIGHIESDLAWGAAPSADVTVVEDTPAPGQPDAVLWSGSITFGQPPEAGRFRVVVREFEVLPRDPSPAEAATGAPVFGQRIVYAAIIPYDFPSNRSK